MLKNIFNGYLHFLLNMQRQYEQYVLLSVAARTNTHPTTTTLGFGERYRSLPESLIFSQSSGRSVLGCGYGGEITANQPWDLHSQQDSPSLFSLFSHCHGPNYIDSIVVKRERSVRDKELLCFFFFTPHSTNYFDPILIIVQPYG